jgi:uncharacterized phage-associated protein
MTAGVGARASTPVVSFLGAKKRSFSQSRKGRIGREEEVRAWLPWRSLRLGENLFLPRRSGALTGLAWQFKMNAPGEEGERMSVFRVDVAKTIQCICLLLKAMKKDRLEYISLLKLLYIADRESLAERGAPITGDVPVAMRNGPVLSAVYSLIRLERERDLVQWLQFLHTEDYDLQMKGDPGTALLSKYEERKLSEIAQRFAGHSWRELVDHTHTFEEWKLNDPDKEGVSVRVISLDDILRAVGRGDQIESIKADLEARVGLSSSLAAS